VCDEFDLCAVRVEPVWTPPMDPEVEALARQTFPDMEAIS
jgi:hypothetical protein